MSNFLVRAGVVLGGLFAGSVAFAQGDGSSFGWIPVGSGLAIGLAAMGAALAQGKTAGSALEGIARNPNAKDSMFQSFILGLVFCELQALLGFVIAFLWLTKLG